MSSGGYEQYIDAKYFVDRLKELNEVLSNTTNPVLFDSRRKVIDKIHDILATSKDINHVVSRVIDDYSTFCACFLDGQEAPLIPVPWQEDATVSVEENNRVTILSARKIGKSTWCSSYILWDCIRNKNRHHIIFAPTKGQLFVMKDFVRHVKSHPLFHKGFVANGKAAATEVEFSVTNSSVLALNIGLHENFDLKRGVAGNRIWVDEFALVSSDAREELIDPLLRESIGGQITKKLVLIGTPKLSHNPGLMQEIENSKENPNVKVIKVDCWQAIDQGIKDPEKMKDVFKYELNIPCEYVQKYGVCPEFLPHWFEDPPDNPHGEDGKCPCWNSDKFLMEELAEFAVNSDRFFPVQWISATEGNFKFTGIHNADPISIDYYMSVDLGLLTHPSVVTVGHIVVPKNLDKLPYLKLDYWEEIPPFDPGEGVSGTSHRHIKRIKALNKLFEPKKVFVDATRALDTVEMLCSGDNPIRRSRMYADDTLSKKDGVGIWWSGPNKTKMFSEYKRLLDQGRIKVPGPRHEGVFWQQWWNDHFHVQAEPTRDGNYLKFNETGHTVDSMVMLSLCLSKAKGNGSYVGFDYCYY